MRRIFTAIAIIGLLCLPVWAFSGVTSAQSTSVVDADGGCQVTLALNLTMDTAESPLLFPLPEQARDISVNGSRVSSSLSGSVRTVDLSHIAAAPGNYSITIRYSLEDVILANEEEESLFLTLELLSGFSYPIDSLEFTLELPEAVEADPSFTSSYYQETVETMMTVTHEGTVIRGRMHQRLQDHEKLILSLPVTEEMFPQPVAKRWSMDTVDLWMLGLGAAAVLYWLIFLRCPILRRLRRTTAPDGITAGELPCRLTGTGADLTLTVLSWAQMGYLLIQPDDNDRVLLHKRMEMGNERSDFEQKWFRRLFGKRSVIDGTGMFYARQCQKARREKPGLGSMLRKDSGNPALLRILAASVGAVNGISLGTAYAGTGGWGAVLSLILAVCGFAVAWWIQGIGRAFHSRHRLCILLGLGAAGIWLLLSFPAGEWNIALIQMPLQFLAGLAAFYSGRRSESGLTGAGEILGLRDYLKNMDPGELKRNLAINPQYYYDLAPYALALGIDRPFARKLGNTRLPECPYLTTGMDGHLTAAEWNQLLRDTVSAMDAQQSRLWLDKLLRR